MISSSSLATTALLCGQTCGQMQTATNTLSNNKSC